MVVGRSKIIDRVAIFFSYAYRAIGITGEFAKKIHHNSLGEIAGGSRVGVAGDGAGPGDPQR